MEDKGNSEYSCGMDIKEQCLKRIAEEAKLFTGKRQAEEKLSESLVLQCLHANHLGDGILFAVMHEREFVFNNAEASWLQWGGYHWIQDKTNRAAAAVETICEPYMKLLGTRATICPDDGKEMLKEKQELQREILRRVRWLRTEKGRQEVLKFAAANKIFDLHIEGNEIDRKPLLLACANGVVHLPTGELWQGDPLQYLVKASPVKYRGATVPAPLWEKTIDEIFGGDAETIEYLQRVLGYCISGLTRERLFLALVGPKGWNGKSTVVETLAYILGPLAQPIASEMLLSNKNARNSAAPSPDIMALRGLRMAFASEADENRRYSPAMIKRLTGGDTLTGRAAHAPHEVSFKPSHKIILLTNEIPTAPADDEAFWRRYQSIKFPFTFVDEPKEPHERQRNKNLFEELTQEAPGILAWLVRGFMEYERIGLKAPASVQDEVDTHRALDDFLGTWITEEVLEREEASTRTSNLYARFDSWYRENYGKKPPGMTVFVRKLSKRFESGKDPVTRRSVFYGLELTKEAAESLAMSGR
jgi:putative DNA primase/helicase